MHPSDLRSFHASQLFHAIRSRQGVSQRELVEFTGCDKSTVSVIVKRFEEVGLIEKTVAERDGKRGRPQELWRISELSGLLVGVHLELDVMRFVAAHVDGRPFAFVDSQLPQTPDGLDEIISEGVERLCASIERGLGDIRAVGVSLPGLVESSGVFVRSPTLKWGRVSILPSLRDKLAAPVFVDNDANASALAEHLFGRCAEYSDFLMIEGGLGLGGGVFSDGRLFRGRNGFAGELGHIKVVRDGRVCSCGSSGCLSAYLSARELVDRASRIADVSSLEELLAAAVGGNEAIHHLLNQAGQFLGIALATLVNVFNPEAIALGGIVARLWPFIEAATRRSLAENAMSEPAGNVVIVVSEISGGEVPWGGVALALEGFSSHSPFSPSPW